MMLRRRVAGFTLIELMITVAVVGILGAIAYPTYKNAMIKNRRSAVQATMADIAQREQLYLGDNRAYASALTGASSLSYTVPSDVSTYYTITIDVVAGPPPSYTITATPVSTQSNKDDGTLTLTSAGVKSPSDKWAK